MDGKAARGKVEQRFTARLEKGDKGLGWTIARVPFEPGKVWKEMVRLRVKGTVNGFAFRTSLFAGSGLLPGSGLFPGSGLLPGSGLFPFAEGGGFYVLVNKAMQRGGDVALGDVAEFSLEPDFEARPAELPDELAVLLDEEEGLREFYESFSESMRREMGKWVAGVKSEESRMKRVEQLAERLMGAMEGEKELPPVVAAAFKRRPKAKAGWAKMTQLQRRGELLAVFYYQSPEARLKRVERLCDLAEKKG